MINIDLNDILKNFVEKKNNDDGEAYDKTIIFKIPKYLTIFFNRNTNYFFLSIIKNFGNLNYGHYTTICRISENNWYKFNDLLYEISKNGYRSKNAIILLYKRIS